MNRIFSSCALLLLPSIACSGLPVSNDASQLQLNKAVQLEKSSPWQAATIYCKFSRIGSTEAQYRLGMLFAFGQGVPKDRNIAASLFAIAAQQGHQEASNMLETIHYSSEKMPDCVLTGVNPPHATLFATFDGLSLEGALAKLSKDKHWIIQLVQQVATWHHVDPKLALSIISIESDFQPSARSKANAMGLMQLIPVTAQRFNVKDAFNVSQNVKGGVRYLRWLLDRYNGEIELVAAAYNAGEAAVDKYKGIPPYRETIDYVSKILTRYPHRKHVISR